MCMACRKNIRQNTKLVSSFPGSPGYFYSTRAYQNLGSCPAVLDICWGEDVWVGNDIFPVHHPLEIQVD